MKEKRNQPAAQEYCLKKFNGPLHDLQSNINEIFELVEKGERFWTGVVFNQETKEYDQEGTKFSFDVKFQKKKRELCVIAQKKGSTFEFSSSKCCSESAYFICRIKKNEMVSSHSPGTVITLNYFLLSSNYSSQFYFLTCWISCKYFPFFVFPYVHFEKSGFRDAH